MKIVRYERFGLQGMVLSPPRPMDRIHHHTEVELNYIFRGGITYLHQWKYRKVATGQLVVFWGSPPHSVVSVLPGTEMAWITVPLPWVLQWPIPARTREALIDGRWCFSKACPNRYPVREWVVEINGGGSEALMLELQACFLRLKIRGYKPPNHSTETPAGGWNKVEKMARYMAEHFVHDIGIDEIASAAKLHPKYAMNLFRKCYGVTLHNYLERHRLAHAQRLLITTVFKIIEIAHASGFNSLSAFYNRFEKHTACSPKVFRKRHAVIGPP